MDLKNLLKKYPNLITKCREWDCSYDEAVKKLDSQKKKGTLLEYF